MPNNIEYILEMEHCIKEFPGVRALNDVSFKVKRGEVHALMGENGAGKSTLMKILAGIYQLDEGKIILNGHEVSFHNPSDALHHGVSMIHQELNNIMNMTVEQNIFIGREECVGGVLSLVNKQKQLKESWKLLKSVDLNINPNRKISSLSVAEMQMVEIIKAVSYDADIIIMDEPTSAITGREVEKLFYIIRQLKKQGKAIIYISHKLDEIMEICDRVTVLRDGCYIDTKDIACINKEIMISMMVGRELKEMFDKECTDIGDTCLEIKNFSLKGQYKDINFKVRYGEILGIAGLMGAGRTELVESIFGIRKKDSGELFLGDKKINIRNPMDAIKLKIALVTEDRKLFGLNLKETVKNNITLLSLYRLVLGWQLLNLRKERELSWAQVKKLKIKTPSLDTKVVNLSGGNQQKVVLAKWLLEEPDVLILDEPTRGIDVGAKSEIYNIISELAKSGKAIIMISSELPELFGMSDRIIVLHEGRITGEFSRGEFDQESIMTCATCHSGGAM